MVRTVLISLLVALSLLGAPSSVEAATERLIAVIMVKGQPRYQAIHKVFTEQLPQATAQNYRLYVQSPNADVMSLRNSARKAVAIGADLIVVYGTAAALAAQSESRNTPVLFADVYDPVKQGLVDRDGLAKGRTVGVRGDGPIQTLLKAYLKATDAKRLAALYNPKSPSGKIQLEAISSMGKHKGFSVEVMNVSRASDLPGALQGMSSEIEGLLVADCSVLAPALKEIVAVAQKRGAAVISQIPGSAELGGFMALENDPVEQGTMLAGLAAKVLSGVNVEELSLVKPRNISLTVNLKVAKQLGISVPFDVLSMTSRVIR